MRLNRCDFAGNIGKDGELRYMASGTPQLQFTLAVDAGFMKDGKWQDATEWVNVIAWGDLAERQAERVVKGKPCYVSARMQTRTWDDDKGQKHYRTEYVANNIQVWDRAPKDAPQAAQEGRSASKRGQAAPFGKGEEPDLPWE